jgi:hypothetical protein
MYDRTQKAVERQIKGLGATLFEVGVLMPTMTMLRRKWDKNEVIKSIQWLKSENCKGAHIYFRHADQTGIVLVDDLNRGKIEQMKQDDNNPAVVIQTSSENFQAWVKVSNDIISNDVLTEIAKILCKKYDADKNSAHGEHFGRLAGFTNRKIDYVDENGMYPFVLLESYSGKIAENSKQLIKDATNVVNSKHKIEHIVFNYVPNLENNRIDEEWYFKVWETLKKKFETNLDYSFADWVISLKMYSKGCSFDFVKDCIINSSFLLEDRKKGHIEDYALRTASRALAWHTIKRNNVDAIYQQSTEQINKFARNIIEQHFLENEESTCIKKHDKINIIPR